MIKSLTLSARSLVCYNVDGSCSFYQDQDIPSAPNLLLMLNNIKQHGETEFIGGATQSITTALTAWGYKIVDKDEGTFVHHNGKDIPIKPLEDLLTHTILTGNKAPAEALIERLSNIQRQHSVDDLLKFLTMSDLPITAHGYILAYKLVNKTKGHNYDKHSNSVLNDVGCYVHMEEKDVDPDRTQDCSYGLHIASRGYLRGFGGNTLLAVLVKPEDVIAVPQYNPQKMRVMAYTVVHEFTNAQRDTIVNGDPITQDIWDVLKAFLEMEQIPVTQEVFAVKGKCKVTPVNRMVTEEEPVKLTEGYVKEVASAPVVEPLKDLKALIKPTFKELLVQFKKADRKAKPAIYAQLCAIKKARKKSWDALGASPEMCRKLSEYMPGK